LKAVGQRKSQLHSLFTVARNLDVDHQGCKRSPLLQGAAIKNGAPALSNWAVVMNVLHLGCPPPERRVWHGGRSRFLRWIKNKIGAAESGERPVITAAGWT